MKIEKVYGTDKTLEESGVWVRLADDGEVLIARLWNSKHRKVMRRLLKPYESRVRRKTLPPEQFDELNMQGVAEAVLLNWRNMENETGPVEYSKENAVKWLTEYKDFRDDVLELAGEMETFRLVQQEESEKNLQTS